MSSVQATRLRKGNLIKLGNDLFRIMELHHLTPGNKRGFIQARMRNIRTSALADQKFRAEEDLERAVLDEREMQYLYNDGDSYYFMDTSSFEQVQISLEALGDSKDNATLDRLATRELVERLERRPGQKEERYRHLLDGQEPSAERPRDARDVGDIGPARAAPGLEARVAALEAEIVRLRTLLAQLSRPDDVPPSA